MANLYRISQNTNTDYDTYDSAVVVAETAEQARNIHPGGRKPDDKWPDFTWAAPEDVTVQLIGVAAADLAPGTIVCASFHAG